MKKELLSPAGDFECLKMAVLAGANAIYIGGKQFGARKFASNFSDEEIITAIKYCHLYGVKLYVTVNTVIYENEINDCIKYVEFLHQNGIDAIIVQDIGLINVLKNMFPNLEIHASTQCHNYNQEQFDVLEKLGVTRVVLAREMSIDEVNKINTPLEKEVFIHGAICISYSGQCLFSSLIMNRSGNRGECSGMCRLPYKLETENGKTIPTDGNYLLSPKELSTIEEFKYLMDSDIKTFKIEGRMKNKEYVYLVTKIYRTLIDKYEMGLPLEITEEDYKNLKILYNREFTTGHLFNKIGNDLMNIKTPNHIGIEIGNVVDFDKKKIVIELIDDLYQEDGIRFVSNNKGMILNFIYDINNKLINKAKKGDKIIVDNRINLDKKCQVLKTSSNYLNKNLVDDVKKKIPITVKVEALIGKKLKIEINDGNNFTEIESIVVEPAINNITSKEVIYEKLSKLGDTPFIIKDINFNIDNNIFVPLSNINEIRRMLVANLIKLRENNKKDVIKKEYKENYLGEYPKNIKLSILVNTEEQIKIALNNINGDIYVTNYDLYLKYKNKDNVYYQIPRLDKNIHKLENEKLLITDLSNIIKYKNNQLVSDYYLNVVNSSYINYLVKNKVNKVTLSVENNVLQIQNILDKFELIPNVEVVIYGKIELMIMKHCILNHLVNNGKFPCECCNNNYYLVDRNNQRYKIVSDKMISKIYSYKNNVYSDDDIIKLKNIGVKNFRINLLDEDDLQTNKIIKKYKKLLDLD